MTDELPLAALQRWMLSVITSTERSPEPGPGASPEVMATLVRPSATLSAAERIATYHRAYHARLLAAFQDMFPALRHAVGDELLEGFVLDYLAEHPPASFTLSDLPAAFPAFLEATRPDRDAPPAERERWPDFLIELAALERTVLEVAEGPGLEGRPLPDARAPLTLTPHELLQKRLSPAPCLRLFTCAWPVHRYLQEVRRGGRPELPEPRPSLFAVTRRDYRVALHDLTITQHAFLSACDGRRTIAGALEPLASLASLASLERPGAVPIPDTGNLRDWLCEWVARGFFEAVE